MNWETLPTLACLWMSILVAAQYFRKTQASSFTMSFGYFFILFLAGVVGHLSTPVLNEVSNGNVSGALRVFASGLLLTLVSWHSGNIDQASYPSGKKRSALIKLPILIALLAISLYQYPRVYSAMELVLAICMFLVLRSDQVRQAVRLRLFVKGSALGFLFLVFKLGFSNIVIFQVLALLCKLAAFYYLYCLVSSYVAESYLQKYSKNHAI